MRLNSYTTDEIEVAIRFALHVRHATNSYSQLSDTSLIYMIADHFVLSFDEASKLFNRTMQI